MGKFLKKNLFVVILAAVFAVVSVYYIYEDNKGKLKGKSAGGEDVVYEVNGQDIAAGAFYDSLYETNGTNALYQSFTRAVVDQAVEATDAMKSEASSQAATILQNYASSYPTTYDVELGNALKQLGYNNGIDDLKTYTLDYLKQLQLVGEYAQAHVDDLQIRDISYLLVQFEDSQNPSKEGEPTDDEQSRMDAVDKELAAGTSFADTAAKFSEDTSTASAGGHLGVIDKNTDTLDPAFLSAALALKEGETSSWVYSSSFGYFRIHVNAASADSMIQNYKDQQAYEKEAAIKAAEASATPEAAANATASPEASAVTTPEATAETTAAPSATPEAVEEPTLAQVYNSLISSYDTSIAGQALWDKAQELGITFDSDDTEARLKTALGIAEPEASATPSAETTATPSAAPSASPSAKAD